MQSKILWNPKVKLIISDVDETVADLYTPCVKEMHIQLESILKEGIRLFFISGQGLQSVKSRITDLIEPPLRKNILIGHCSGVEVWGFDEKGEVLSSPFYSLYDGALTDSQKVSWRNICKLLIQEFNLTTYDNMVLKDFASVSKGSPLTVMYEDRGPQITFEFVNSIKLTPSEQIQLQQKLPFYSRELDLRIPFMRRMTELFEKEALPLKPRLAGEFAVDITLDGVTKTTAVEKALNNPIVFSHLDLPEDITRHPEWLEVWGDKFSTVNGGTDRHILEALPKEVRAVNFRNENPDEMPQSFNLQFWNGNEHLHHGTLEYLSSRKKPS